MPNGKRKYPPLPGFDWEFPWEELSQSWEAWQQQVSGWGKRAPEDEPGTFEYMMKQWQPAPPKYPAPTATMPWPEEARYPEGAKVGPFPAWGDFPYGGPEWGRYEIERGRQPYVEQQRAALRGELEWYAKGLMSFEELRDARETWETAGLEQLQYYLREAREKWEWTIGRKAAGAGPSYSQTARVSPQLRRTMQAAEELGVDTSWVEESLRQPGYTEDLAIGLLGQRMLVPKATEAEKERREQQKVQQQVRALYPEEFAKIAEPIGRSFTGYGRGFGPGGFEGPLPNIETINVSMIEQDPEYQKLKERYEWETSPEYATEKEREKAEAERARIEAEAEWERMRRVEMGARGRWEIPRQW